MSDYSLDGEKVGFVELIEAAEKEGYIGLDGDPCIRTTSGAAQVLRDNGHSVSAWVDPEGD